MEADSIEVEELTADELKLMDELAESVGIGIPRPSAKDGWFTAIQFAKRYNTTWATAYNRLKRGCEDGSVELKKYRRLSFFRMVESAEKSDE